MISESDVNEVSIEEGEFKIKIKKSADVTNNYNGGAPQYMTAMPQQFALPTAPSAPATPAAPSAKAEPAAPSANQVTIKSPMVGTFYKSPNPDAAPFAKVGDTIAKGDTICIIEAMKIMNEVTSDYSGKVVKVLVENAQPIEFDQPLFIIEQA